MGGAGGNRTHDLRVKSPLLCQLSYSPKPQDTALRVLLPPQKADAVPAIPGRPEGRFILWPTGLAVDQEDDGDDEGY